jgi:hypothetical protein
MPSCFHVWEEAGHVYLGDISGVDEAVTIWQCCLCGEVAVTDENEASPLPQASGN